MAAVDVVVPPSDLLGPRAAAAAASHCSLPSSRKRAPLCRRPSIMRRFVYRNAEQSPPEKQAKHDRGMDSPGKNGKVSNALLLVRNLVQHFNSREQSDVTLKVGNRRFYLHKILLARSEVFSTMMLGQLWDDARQQEIELQESAECVPHMEAFFRYFYTAEISLSRDNVLPILILANKYNVRDLEEAAERHATKLVFSGTETDQIIEWWHLAAQLNLRLLNRKCKDYLILNMDAVLQSSHFLDLSLDYLCLLIMERDMVIRSEYTLYRAVLRWLAQIGDTDTFTDSASKIFTHIKFSMMSLDELLEIEQSLEQQPRLQPLLTGYLYTAYKFHALPFHKRGTVGMEALDSPRLYTAARVPKIGATLRLHTYEREALSAGVAHDVTIPISLSNADRADSKTWKLVFHERNDRIQLEICSALCSSEQFELVEASVLIYKHVNNITIVKGVMQFRCSLKNMPDVPCGHVFNVLLPKESLDANSPYLISDESGEYCQFCIVWRHYHGDVFAPAEGSEGLTATSSTVATTTTTSSSSSFSSAASSSGIDGDRSPHTTNFLPPSAVENLAPRL